MYTVDKCFQNVPDALHMCKLSHPSDENILSVKLADDGEVCFYENLIALHSLGKSFEDADYLKTVIGDIERQTHLSVRPLPQQDNPCAMIIEINEESFKGETVLNYI